MVAVQGQRGQWADEDRNALNQMIFTVISNASDQEKTKAVQGYASTAKANDKKRKANPLPDKVSC